MLGSARIAPAALMRAFAAAVRGEPANLTPPADSVATMSLIDDIYTAAGLPLCG